MRAVLVCCVLLTITISASCFQKNIRHQQVKDRKLNKSIIKRDASLLLNASPIDIDPVYKVHPVIAFRRLSRSRQTPGPLQSARIHKSSKKYRKPTKPKHNPRKPYRPGFKPKYYRKKVVSKNSNYPKPPKYLQQFSLPQNDGFGEPPSNVLSFSKNEQQPRPKPEYTDELVDSYGEPIQSLYNDDIPSAPIQINKEQDLSPGYNRWRDYQKPNGDNAYAYSKKRPVYDTPQTYNAQNIDDEQEIKLNDYYYWLKEKPNFNMEQSKFVRLPWKVTGNKRAKDENEILVGGQYAEPPARYIPRFQPSAPMYEDDEDFAPAHGVIDSKVATSATRSPYVNYKHSNMAFSPQNLNDAFSIVEN